MLVIRQWNRCVQHLRMSHPKIHNKCIFCFRGFELRLSIPAELWLVCEGEGTVRIRLLQQLTIVVAASRNRLNQASRSTRNAKTLGKGQAHTLSQQRHRSISRSYRIACFMLLMHQDHCFNCCQGLRHCDIDPVSNTQLLKRSSLTADTSNRLGLGSFAKDVCIDVGRCTRQFLSKRIGKLVWGVVGIDSGQHPHLPTHSWKVPKSKRKAACSLAREAGTEPR